MSNEPYIILNFDGSLPNLERTLLLKSIDTDETRLVWAIPGSESKLILNKQGQGGYGHAPEEYLDWGVALIDAQAREFESDARVMALDMLYNQFDSQPHGPALSARRTYCEIHFQVGTTDWLESPIQEFAFALVTDFRSQFSLKQGPSDLQRRIRDESATKQPKKPSPEKYVFRKKGDMWEIAFEGPQFLLRDSKGLQYIALLLANPNQDFHAMKLVSLVEKTQPGTGASELDGKSDDALSEDGMGIGRGGGMDALLDEEGMVNLKARLKAIAQERQEAQQRHDSGKLAKLDNEVAWIEAELRGATGLLGRKRSFVTPQERARVSVFDAIKRAKGNIRKQDRKLSEYLDRTIETGMHCVYKPDPLVDWNF